MADQARFTTAIFISLLLHALLLALLPLMRRGVLTLPQPAPLEVALVPLRKPRAPRPVPVNPPAEAEPPPPVLLPEQQIVTPPDAGEEKEPEKTRFLSDRNVTVPEESVHRGGGKEGGGDTATAKAEKPPPAPARPEQAKKLPEQVASLPSLSQLLPNAGDLVRQGRVPEPAEAKPEKREPSGRDFLASGRTGIFSAQPGTTDFLPTIREGNITLLNTKADLFAPFVRRVAVRIFQNLEISFSRELRARGGLQAGRQAARVEAVMDKKGNFVSARLLERTGSNGLQVDRKLLDSARPDIFFDANPPRGAEAADGNIHFVLEVDMTVDIASDARTGRTAPTYYGVAGVGLM